MITVISGVNRPGSRTLQVAKNAMELFEKKGVAAQLLDLEKMPLEVLAGQYYGNQHPDFQQLCDQYIVPVGKFLFISPEYNGSIPGILKCLFDYSEVKSCWKGKKAAMIGVASGRAGNLRGLDHLTNILLHLGTTVWVNKLPISGIHTLLDEGGKLDDSSRELIARLIDELVDF